MKVKLYRRILKELLPRWRIQKADSLWTEAELRNAKLVEISHMWKYAKTIHHNNQYTSIAQMYYNDIHKKYERYSRKYWTPEAIMKRVLRGDKE